MALCQVKMLALDMSSTAKKGDKAKEALHTMLPPFSIISDLQSIFHQVKSHEMAFLYTLQSFRTSFFTTNVSLKCQKMDVPCRYKVFNANF